MKSLGMALCVLVLGVLPAGAQTSRFEFSGGYSFLHEQDRSEDYPAGWVAAGTGNVTDWIGVSAEVSGNYRTCNKCQRGPFTSVNSRGKDLDLAMYTFMAGPRLAARMSRVTPFAQVLLGGTHMSGGAEFDGALSTGFSYQPGGGVDVYVTPTLGLRVQGDYRVVRTEGLNNNASRVVVGLVWRQGQ